MDRLIDYEPVIPISLSVMNCSIFAGVIIAAPQRALADNSELIMREVRYGISNIYENLRHTRREQR